MDGAHLRNVSEIKQCLYCKINRALDLFHLVRVYLLCFMARERQTGDSLKKFKTFETCLNICSQRGRVKVGRCSCRRPWKVNSFFNHECTARAESRGFSSYAFLNPATHLWANTLLFKDRVKIKRGTLRPSCPPASVGAGCLCWTRSSRRSSRGSLILTLMTSQGLSKQTRYLRC